MANVTITQLPAAGPITGDELVPVVQNGVTVHTTVQAISSSPSQSQTFLTINQEPTLPNSQYLSTGAGLGLQNGGPQSYLRIVLNGVCASIETASDGFLVKTGGTAIASRQIAASGAGISVSNGTGLSGNPTVSLSGLPLSLAQTVGTGLLAIRASSTLTPVSILGTANQIDVANGSAWLDNPQISIASDPTLPGNAGVNLPSGSTGQRPGLPTAGLIRYNTSTTRFEGYNGAWFNLGLGDGTVTNVSGTADQILVSNGSSTPVVALAENLVLPGVGATTFPRGNTAARPISPLNGMFRYNTQTAQFEGYANGAWGAVVTGTAGVTSVATGVGLLGGPITSTGTIDIDTTVVATLDGVQTLTGKTISGASNTLTNIANASLTNSSVTFNGVTVALGASGTITATATNALTIGTGLTGASYNGSAAVTIAIDSTVATLTGTQTLTNKTIDANNNTLSNIPNSSLTNSQITLGTTAISLGGTSLAPVGLTSVTVTQNPVSDYQLATKQYVDNLVATGTTYHTPVKYEVPNTTGNLVATYNNGTAGVGATLTNAGTLAAFTPDGITALVGDRVLVYNQTNAYENGVYTVTVVGNGLTPWVLTRATDADSAGPGPDGLDEGSTFFVTSGNTGAGETYTCTTPGTIVFGTTAINFAQIGFTQVYSAGTGLTLTGTQFSISNTAVTAASYGGASKTVSFTVNAQGQLTFASETNIAIDGNQITSGTVGSSYISGSYTGITGVGTITAGTWNASTIGVAYGGTGLTSYTTGDLLYASGSTTLSKLGIGAAGYVLTAGVSAPQYTAQSSLDVGNAANVTTTAVTANSTYYPAFMPATSGSNGVCVDVDMTYNPSTNTLTLANLVATSGISGGTF